MKINSKKRLFLPVLSIGLLLSSCSSLMGGHRPKALVLYASDSAELAQTFSKPLTAKLNKEKIFLAQEKQVITQHWIANSIAAQSEDNKNKMSRLINDLKNTYQTKPIEDAKLKSQSSLATAQQILLKSNSSLASEYSELAFWAAVVNYDDPVHLGFPANIYISLAGKKERARLEEQTSPKIVSLILNSANQVRYVKVSRHDSSCTIYLNGKLISRNSFRGVSGGNNVLTSYCDAGSYTRLFNPEKTNHITMTPVVSFTTSNPPPAQLPINEISKLKIDSAVLIYLSDKGKYIDTDIYDVHTKKFYYSRRINTTTESDRKNAEDVLIDYLESMSSKVTTSK